MKNRTIAASDFKARCLRLLDEVQEGAILVITKRGHPVARVVPISPPRRTLRGTWKNSLKIRGDIVHFDTSQDWESNR